MGHMLNQTEMDIIVRWHRMLGDTTLWLPGTDHAGIATQMMVERQLAAEGKERLELGRERFIERVWEWKRHFGGAIFDQMKRLGASVDWSREYFTMDERLSNAVREAFVRLYEQALIYRGAYIVNWCPRCMTAISDLEVVHEEQQGHLYEIRYRVLGTDNLFITVATTRPETILGDVAVAVNPDDARYRSLHGKSVWVPLTEREVPIILDELANPEFGTGAVKVTPAHDSTDFQIGLRHHLPQISVMDEAAHMNAAAGAYGGLDRHEARQRVLADLQAQGLLVSAKEHTLSIGKCDRCKTVVEPRLSTQWFIKIQPLADRAIAAVENGHVRFTPEQYGKTYFEWMRNIHDWCISRQLWWGHRIPAWHCRRCGEITVARDIPAACFDCGSAEIEQETDVLDTWFSSGLLPFSSLGWPEHTPDLDAFYPTSLLITGFDILFFWVARMVMLGCWFMEDMPNADGSRRAPANAVPFREVYIHALVRDAERQKMSKTKGNVIDPIEIIERFGTDAVRFTLAAMASPGTDIAFSEARTEGYRAFANKIWNAARFLFMNVDRAQEAGAWSLTEFRPNELAAGRHLEERWIVSRLNQVVTEVNEALSTYRFHEAAAQVYAFFWNEFCDWYIEIAKLRLDFLAPNSGGAAALNLALATFEEAVRLLSPFMPFITEEIWHAIYDGNAPAASIALSRYPQPRESLMDRSAETDMSILQDLIVAVRNIRAELKVEVRQKTPIRVFAGEPLRRLFFENWLIIERLANAESIEFAAESLANAAGSRSTSRFDVLVVYEKKMDVAAERERLKKDLEKFQAEIARSQAQLGNTNFLAKAPSEVVEGLRRRSAELAILIEKARGGLGSLDGQET